MEDKTIIPVDHYCRKCKKVTCHNTGPEWRKKIDVFLMWFTCQECGTKLGRASVFENNKIGRCVGFISEAGDVVPIKQVRGY